LKARALAARALASVFSELVEQCLLVEPEPELLGLARAHRGSSVLGRNVPQKAVVSLARPGTVPARPAAAR